MSNKCKVAACSKEKRRRYVLCPACWAKLPEKLKFAVRSGTDKGEHSLRAKPTKEWYEAISKYVGKIKLPYIVGAGINAVKLHDEPVN